MFFQVFFKRLPKQVIFLHKQHFNISFNRGHPFLSKCVFTYSGSHYANSTVLFAEKGYLFYLNDLCNLYYVKNS
jgi:hypothetical protein